jgi:ubiquitin C-terminal hydrolase
VICYGCPHRLEYFAALYSIYKCEIDRYEREERFHAINLPLRADGLHASLDQFVHGELLDGDNAYLCETCGVKRTTLKRTCIKVSENVFVSIIMK